MRVLLVAIIFAEFSAQAIAPTKLVGCDDPKLQVRRSAELIKIAQEDQADREKPYEAIDWNKVNPRDLQRRIKVASIFAEGCFKSAADYTSAATVYQHGTTADHYYQVFVWANQALKLGDTSQRGWVATGLDRYLVKIGHKQLFGTQLSKNPDGKWCVQPVEVSFPESLRAEYMKFSVKEQIAYTLKAIGSTQSPGEVRDCEPALNSTPKGTVPGFW